MSGDAGRARHRRLAAALDDRWPPTEAKVRTTPGGVVEMILTAETADALADVLVQAAQDDEWRHLP